MLAFCESRKFIIFSLSHVPNLLKFRNVTLEYILYARSKRFFFFKISRHFSRVSKSFISRLKKNSEKSEIEKNSFVQA